MRFGVDLLLLESAGIVMHSVFYTFAFFFNDTATTEIYTLSLHDALPISARPRSAHSPLPPPTQPRIPAPRGDRKSTRLNSSHANISYAVFCLKKKNQRHRRNAGSATPVRSEIRQDLLR